MRSGARAVAAMIVFCVTLQMLVAQGGTTSLRGTVSDTSGAAVSGAAVVLTNDERSFNRAATTSATGSYEFLQLQPGTYHLSVEMAGFRKVEQKNVALLVDTPSTINFKLDVGSNRGRRSYRRGRSS